VNNSWQSGTPRILTITLQQLRLAGLYLTHYFFKTLHNIIFKNEIANLLFYLAIANSFTVGVRFNIVYDGMQASHAIAVAMPPSQAAIFACGQWTGKRLLLFDSLLKRLAGLECR